MQVPASSCHLPGLSKYTCKNGFLGQFSNFQINFSEKQLSTKISQKNKKDWNKNYSGFVIHVKWLNQTDEYLIYHVELSMLKSNMPNLASINEWDIFTLFQILKKINFGNIKKN